MIEPSRVMRENPRKPLKCWGYGGPHLCRNCPLENGNEGQVHSTQEAETVGHEAVTIPNICAVLEDHQEGHKATVVEVKGQIVEHTVSLLIDPGSTHSYITPELVEMCTLKRSKHRISWLVKLATGTKKKVSEVVSKCPLVMDGLVTYSDLNVLPLGSYDILIGMDWLEAHRVKLDYYINNFECIDEEGNLRIVRGIPKVIYVR